MAQAMEALQSRLQGLSEQYTKHQEELREVIASRQKLEAQRQENLGVQKELGKLKGDENIYKLIGPVLLKQEKVDADSTVNGRIEFIGKEINRQEDKINDLQSKMDKIKNEIIQLQSSAQAAVDGPQASAKAVKA